MAQKLPNDFGPLNGDPQPPPGCRMEGSGLPLKGPGASGGKKGHPFLVTYPLKLQATWGSSHLLQTFLAHVTPKSRETLCVFKR